MLLLDEPTGDLDTLNTIRIMNLLVELNNMGTTLSKNKANRPRIVMVTHDMQLPSIARRVVVVSDGKVKDVIENSEEQRFRALQQLNEGIEDLTVFESGSSSVDSRMHCVTTGVRHPSDYDRVHVLETREDSFGYGQFVLDSTQEESAESNMCPVS